MQQHHRIHSTPGLRVCFEKAKLRQGCVKKVHNSPKWKLCRGNHGDRTNPTITSVITKRSARWSRKWCETINTRTPQSQHGHRKYRWCHWDRKKYNWALRVHNVRVKCTAYRHFLDVGHTYSVMCEHAWKCTRPQVWIQEHGLFHKTMKAPKLRSSLPHILWLT